MEPYPAADAVSKKRATARRIGTTYAYDFVGLLATAQLQAWRDRNDQVVAFGGEPIDIPSSDQVVVAEELLFDDDAEYGVSTKGSRPVGTNDVGMVGFSCTLGLRNILMEEKLLLWRMMSLISLAPLVLRRTTSSPR